MFLDGEGESDESLEGPVETRTHSAQLETAGSGGSAWDHRGHGAALGTWEPSAQCLLSDQTLRALWQKRRRTRLSPRSGAAPSSLWRKRRDVTRSDASPRCSW